MTSLRLWRAGSGPPGLDCVARPAAAAVVPLVRGAERGAGGVLGGASCRRRRRPPSSRRGARRGGYPRCGVRGARGAGGGSDLYLVGGRACVGLRIVHPMSYVLCPMSYALCPMGWGLVVVRALGFVSYRVWWSCVCWASYRIGFGFGGWFCGGFGDPLVGFLCVWGASYRFYGRS